LRRLTLIFFLLLTTFIVRTQNKVPEQDKYLQYQRLLNISNDSIKCLRLIEYAEKMSDSVRDYNFAVLLFEKANTLLQQRKVKSDSYQTLLPVLYQRWGYCLYQKGDYEAASKLYLKALDFSGVLDADPALKADIFRKTGMNLEKRMVYTKALNYYNEALELYTKLNNEEGKAMVYAHMATIFTHFIQANNQDQADEFFDKAAKIYLNSNKMDMYSEVLNNKGVAKMRVGKFKEAKSIFLNAIRLNPKENTQLYARLYFNTGLIYSDLEKWDSCFYFLNKGKAVSDSANISEQFNGIYYLSMGYCYTLNNKIDKAIDYYKLALKNKTGISSNNYRILYDNIADLYLRQQRYDSAFFYKNQIMTVVDSIYKSELNEHISFENKRIELLEKDYQNQIRTSQQQQSLSNLKKRNFILLCAVAVLIILILFFFLYFKQYRLKLKKEKIQNELDFLKAQLNPHFLFNSLNNIYALLDQDKNKAMTLLVQFCELMRYQLYDCDANYIPLSEELKFLKNYIDFEKLRYEGEINVEHNLKESIGGDIQIIPILLQPFIENAFKYSPKNQQHPGHVIIHVELINNNFSFNVKNLVDVKMLSVLNGNSGLENVKKRLQLLYPGKHELKTGTINGFFRARLTIELSNNLNITNL
jgi:tetratricopeptide (TPR) repeat protein